MTSSMSAEIQEKVDTAIRLVRSDKFEEAYYIMIELENEHSDIIDSIEELRRLRRDSTDLERCYDLLHDIDNWTLVTNDESIATFSRGSGHEFFVRGEMTMDQPLFPVMALFSEIDLIPTWMKRVTVAETLSHPTVFRRMIRYELDLPWPASDRELVCSAVGIPLQENDSFMILLRSVEGSFFGTPVPPVKPNFVRCDLHVGCIHLVRKSANQTHLSFFVHSDPHVQMIPQWLLNLGLKHFIHAFLAAIRHHSTLYEGSVFQERVLANPTYYDTLRQHVDK